MINNWQHFNLQPNFQSIKTTCGKPSDVDMFYLTQDKFLILGEFKNGDMGELKSKQKELLETFIDNYANGGIVIYATHHKTIEQGATNYDVSQCEVEEYYFNGSWHKPRKHTIVQDIFNKYDKEVQMNINCDREKTIFRNERDGRVYYSIGLSKKDKDGNYENGYLTCKFQKDVNIPNKSKIKIIQGWIDFYLKDKITIPYVFINKFELIENEVNEFSSLHIKTENQDTIQPKDNELPF